MKVLFSLLVFAVSVLLSTSAAWAQKTVKAGTIEWTPYGGGTFDLPGAAGYVGISQTGNPANRQEKYNPGRKTQPFVGSSLALSLAKVLWVYGDYAYMFPDKSKGDVTFGSSSGVNTTNRQYWLGGGGIQLAFPTIQRVSPYLEVGMAVLHHGYSSTTSYRNVSSGNPIFVESKSENITVAPHFGGGVRVFVGERHGLKIAVDGNYLTKGIPYRVPAEGVIGSFPTISRKGWGRIAFGYFFQFGRR